MRKEKISSNPSEIQIYLFPQERSEPPGDIKFIGWDKDGTLVRQDFSRIAAKWLQNFGIPLLHIQGYIDDCLNNGVKLRAALKELLKNQRPEVIKWIEKMIKAEIKDAPPVLYDDAREVLYRLSRIGYRQFVLSRAPEYLIRAQMQHLGIARYFETFVGKSHKKGVDGFSEAAKRMGVPYEEIFRPGLLYVGDTVSDAKATKKENVAFVARNNYLGDDVSGNKTDLYTIGRADLVLKDLRSLPDQIPNLARS